MIGILGENLDYRDDRQVTSRGDEFRKLLTSPSYELLRGKLIRIFARRGCAIAEDLADETIARVMEKLDQVVDDYEGDPTRYFYGVARNVLYEYNRRPLTVSLEENRLAAEAVEDSGEEEKAEVRERVERCLSRLRPEERFIISEYYRHDKATKIAHRKELARHLGLGLNALRIKAFRIRRRIRECVARGLPERKKIGRPRNETAISS